jgi:PhnB protein
MSEEDDVPSVVPYLTVNRALDAIEHYRRAFGAEVFLKYLDDDGKRVTHAALGVFGTMIFLSDEFPEYADEVKSPPSVGGTTVALHINCGSPADVDSAIAKAEAAGCRVTMPAADAHWGMRYGRVLDRFGHAWTFGAPLPKL